MENGEHTENRGEISKEQQAQEYLERINNSLESPEVKAMLVVYNDIKRDVLTNCKKASSSKDAASRLRSTVIKSAIDMDTEEIQKFIDNPPLIQALMTAKGDQDQRDLVPIQFENMKAVNPKAIVDKVLLDAVALAYITKDLETKVRQELFESATVEDSFSPALFSLALTPDKILSTLPIINSADLEKLKSNAQMFHAAMRAGREFALLFNDQKIRKSSSEFEHQYGGGPQYLVTRIANSEALDYNKIPGLYGLRKFVLARINKNTDPEKIEYAKSVLLADYINNDGYTEQEAREEIETNIKKAMEK